MLFVVLGAALIAFGCGSFWRLLPREGRVHPLVDKFDGGSTLTIGLMSLVTIGIALLIDGLAG
jgi:hypothetical protein